MATQTVQYPSRDANPITFAAAEAGGDDFVTTGKEVVLIDHTNDAGAEVTLTVATTKTVDGQAVEDRTVAIPAGEFHVLGPFQPGTYGDADDQVSLSWSSETDIELAVLDAS